MIHKKLLSIVILITYFASVQGQNIIFNCDFSNGIPSDFVVIDRDGNEPSRSMKKYGFDTGIGWIGYTENADSQEANGVAYSGSWYTQSAVSDDWMITPAISIDSKYNILSWRAYALDAEHPDGYSVYVSETGNSVEDFKEEAVYTIAGESAEWTTHSIPLDRWAGKTIYIAFVNNSENCNILAIDDINVFSYDNTFSLINHTPKAISSPGVVKVSGSITSSGFMAVEGYTATLCYQGETYTIDRSNEYLEQGETSDFFFDVDIDVALDTTEDYTLTITGLNGADVLVVEGSITCFERLVLLEEGTGTWCAWCPGGQYGIELLHQKYNGKFIDVAVHINDQMSIKEYSDGMRHFFANGIPSCTMNRSAEIVGHPYEDGDELLEKALSMGAIGKIKCHSSVTDNIVTINTTAEFGVEISPNAYALSFLIVEDKMTGYDQSNIYGGSSMEMGGLENLPDPIPAGEYFFANVGRAVYPSFAGDTEAFPVGTPRHTPIEVSRQYELPVLQDINNLKVVAIITDVATKEVVNAALSALEIHDSIEYVGVDNDYIIHCKEARINVTSRTPLNRIEIYNIDGTLLHSANLDLHTYSSERLDRGIYIVKATACDGNQFVSKCIVR